jgi:hypothetical protein
MHRATPDSSRPKVDRQASITALTASWHEQLRGLNLALVANVGTEEAATLARYPKATMLIADRRRYGSQLAFGQTADLKMPYARAD